MRRGLLFFVTALSVLLTSCGGCSSDEGDDEGDVARGALCERDPAVIAEARPCVDSTTCPCGSYCDSSLCIAACNSDADCEAPNTCDDFGRCTNPSVTTTTDAVRDTSGTLVVAPIAMELSAEATRTLRIGAVSESLSRVRISADEGMLIECPTEVQVATRDTNGDPQVSTQNITGNVFGETDAANAVSSCGLDAPCTQADGTGCDCKSNVFVSECLLAGIPENGVAEIGVKRVAGGPVDTSFIRVFAAGQRDTLTVLVPETFGDTLDDLLPGEWEGSLVATRLGFSDTSLLNTADDGGSAQLSGNLRMSVRPSAGGNGYDALLKDPQRILTQNGFWAGTLSPSTDGDLKFNAVFDQIPYVNIIGPDAATIGIEGDGNGGVIGRLDGSARLGMQLETVFEGFAGDGGRIVWAMDMSKLGDVEPFEPPTVTPIDPTEFVNPDVLTPWEEELQITIDRSGSNFASNFGAAYKGDRINLDLCVDQRFGTLEEYRAEYVTGENARTWTNKPSTPRSTPISWFSEMRWQESTVTVQTRDVPFKAVFFGLDAAICAEAGLPDSCADAFAAEVDLVDRNESDIPFAMLPPFETDTIICEVLVEGRMDVVTTDTAGNGAVCGPSSITFNQTVDICAEIAETYDCEIERFDLAVDVPVSFRVDLRSLFDTTATDPANALIPKNCVLESPTDATVPFKATRGCRLPDQPRNCGQAALCVPTGQGTLSSSLESTVLDPNDASSRTGDLRCDSESGLTDLGPGTVLPLEDLLQEAGQAYISCADDLARVGDPVPGAASFGSDGLGEILGGSCIDVGRTLLGLMIAGNSVRSDFQIPADNAIYGRLMQQWVQVLSFVANEAYQNESLAKLLRRLAADGSEAGTFIPPEPSLTPLILGWDLVLHPRYSDTLRRLPASVLRDGVVEGTQVPGPNGIPASIMTASSSTIRFTTEQVEVARFLGIPSVDNTAGPVLRRAVLGSVLASELRKIALSDVQETPDWNADYQRAAATTATELAELNIEIAALNAGENPLGIDESDLPLYFFVDEEGTGRRFTAASDYLLGDSVQSTRAWVPPLIEDAEGALQGALNSWVASQERELQRRLIGAELEGDLLNIRQEYGDQIFDLCGAPAGIAFNSEVLEGWADAKGSAFSPDNCYVDEVPACSGQGDIDQSLQVLEGPNLDAMLCVVDEAGDALVQVTAPEFTSNVRDYQDCVENGGTIDTVLTSDNACGDDLNAPCSICTRGFEAWVIPIGSANYTNFKDVPGSSLSGLWDTCCARHAANSDGCGAPQNPLANANGPRDEPSCYRGEIGQAVLTLRSVAKDIEIARSELSEFTEAYDVAVKSCQILQQGNAGIEASQAAHAQTMQNLRVRKQIADTTAVVAQGSKDCIDAVSGAATVEDQVLSLGAKAGLTFASCGAAAVRTTAQAKSIDLQRQMEQAQASHERMLDALGNEIEENRCFNDAEMHLVGTRTAGLRIQRAIAELDVALFEIDEKKRQAASVWADGQFQLEARKNRQVTPIEHDFWFDRNISIFEERFREAQRASYLAVLAVEYEFQQTLDLRADVLAAELPDDLDRVMRELRRITGPRRLLGRIPEDLRLVLSLRDHLLQIPQLSEEAFLSSGEDLAGWNGLDADRKFALLLGAERFQVYEDGEYAGQRIPFTIMPLTDGLGDPQGIPVLTGTDCAERIWSANAAFVGNQLYARPNGEDGSDPSFLRIDLLKSNTFYSQWCGAEGLQQAKVRPWRNLFAESGGSIDPNGLEFARGRIEAPLGTDRESFGAEANTEGDTRELAGRGLYGEYALFIPSDFIARDTDGDGAPDTSGLDISKVEDILLRLDYVSVAR